MLTNHVSVIETLSLFSLIVPFPVVHIMNEQLNKNHLESKCHYFTINIIMANFIIPFTLKANLR